MSLKKKLTQIDNLTVYASPDLLEYSSNFLGFITQGKMSISGFATKTLNVSSHIPGFTNINDTISLHRSISGYIDNYNIGMSYRHRV